MLDLSSEDLGILNTILTEQMPGVKVLAFGSRVKGRARKFSDLDLALDAGSPIGWSRIGDLKEAFSESDLPIKVDVIDLNDITDRFRELVLSHAIPLPATAQEDR